MLALHHHLVLPRERVPSDAVVARTPLKENEWYHVTVTYDGSRKAAGARIYLNGALQEVNVQADQLKDTIRTGVPFKVGQRNTSERLGALLLENLRIYTRPLAPTSWPRRRGTPTT